VLRPAPADLFRDKVQPESSIVERGLPGTRRVRPDRDISTRSNARPRRVAGAARGVRRRERLGRVVRTAGSSSRFVIGLVAGAQLVRGVEPQSAL